MEIPKSSHSVCNNAKKINRNSSDLNLKKTIAPETQPSDKFEKSRFMTIGAIHSKIKLPDDIKVPEHLKGIWNEVIKDGFFTNDDYKKIVKLAISISSTKFLESYDFIKGLDDKLQANKGIVFFYDQEDEISLNELNELLDIQDIDQ